MSDPLTLKQFELLADLVLAGLVETLGGFSGDVWDKEALVDAWALVNAVRHQAHQVDDSELAVLFDEAWEQARIFYTRAMSFHTQVETVGANQALGDNVDIVVDSLTDALTDKMQECQDELGETLEKLAQVTKKLRVAQALQTEAQKKQQTIIQAQAALIALAAAKGQPESASGISGVYGPEDILPGEPGDD
jgi:hypothetical protein